MGNTRDRLVLFVVVLTEAMTYGLVLTVIAVAGTFLLSVTTGGGTGRANILLFITGWVVIAYATVLLWPKTGRDEVARTGPTQAVRTDAVTRLEKVVHRVPPIRWLDLPPPEDRFTHGGRLFVAGVLIFITSYFLEVTGAVSY